MQRKRKGVIAGSALMLSAALIDYGLVVPKQRTIEPEDIEDQFALLSPTLLAFGLRIAGPPMACMRTSEVVDAYERYVGAEYPKNRSWTFYYCGWGFYVASMALSSMTYMERIEDSADWETLGLIAGVGADLVWAFTCGYSWFYIRKLGAVPVEPKVSIGPGMSRNGTPGLSLLVRF
jgi:hypothetical protein